MSLNSLLNNFKTVGDFAQSTDHSYNKNLKINGCSRLKIKYKLNGDFPSLFLKVETALVK